MTKFEFILDDIDTENFLSILQDNIVNMMSKRIDATPADKEWFNEHIKYLNKLKQTIIDGAKKWESNTSTKQDANAATKHIATTPNSTSVNDVSKMTK